MAVQQHRVSKTRKRKRRTHFKLEQPTLVTCPQCGEYKLPHHACTSCGTYKGRVVLSVK
ncbi:MULTISPECIES: 50S ribosomal protein L32 [Alicyclobacillus]|uniref:Large ribosomal subunit protein bL32 n=4 Tax=Alicyclobacillus TaxID=29330 RepID=C8WW96_ALIAD|nr:MULTISPECIES: 50S ribosomal protein L32 [Alicyclobacillus]ACV58367.1 ribosomal protein L32 [Alicyclobacillus acidocaldarius subsp. acidocaldarius DSM 446]MBF8378346.1 50S ribosomal protein L32 [Alicyclobacillus mali (ex Roth et al. 2021)]MCL6489375.1 50S ribosomal protein L32 [Alicyclobacillus mali (ex Roth et al. 2021)]MDI9259951.1 50S ribosomal protein L32 [Alicyclobacillus sendaiensis PA2]SIT01064.1 LSU ribosomal protein L32P [Alicyclobacillus vulcanalis]